MKIVAFILIFIISLEGKAANFVGTFWEKSTICSDGPLSCLPSAVEKPTAFEFEYPTQGTPTELEITGKSYTVTLFMNYHVGEIDYYTIQMTIKNSDDQIVALCSRYEAVRTIESVPVGSCGGSDPSRKDVLAGFTISLPSLE